MARPRTFDEEAVLDKALECFWRQGYEATSLNDLLAATGLSRQSLYNTFGDKHSLFIRALSRYREQAVAAFEQILKPDASLDDFRDYLRGAIELMISDPERKACMIARSAVELSATDDAVCGQVHAARDQMRTAYTGIFKRAIKRGELAKGTRADALAGFFYTFLQGCAVSVQAGVAPGMLRDSVEVALQMLEAPATQA